MLLSQAKIFKTGHTISNKKIICGIVLLNYAPRISILRPVTESEYNFNILLQPLLRGRAIENQCYVIAAAQVGKHNEKRSSYGHSMVSLFPGLTVHFNRSL